LWENEQESKALFELEENGIQVISRRLTKARSIWNSLIALPTKTPLQAVYCWQPGLLREMNSRLVQGLDIIHVEHLRGARYGLWAKSRISSMGSPVPVVWDSVDCISYLFDQAARKSGSLFSRAVTRLELGRTRRYEGWLVGQFERVLITSSVDKKAMQALSSGENGQEIVRHVLPEPICVLPNGVDLDYFTPPTGPREPDTLVMSGKMSYHANVAAGLYLVNEIMPLVWKKKPHVRVWIAGKDPSPEIRRLGTRYPRHVFVTGTVSDIRPHLRRATVAVCPIKYGAGIQNKVLEAMATGTPVVTTPQAVSALNVRSGEHLLIGDGPESFSESVLALLENKPLQEKLSHMGRCYAEEHHDWNTIVKSLESAYQQAITVAGGRI
jgi:glycosyltransferase involved in cell wall biosynthesis